MMSLQSDTDKNINRALKLLALVLLSIALAGIVFWFLGKIRAVVIILVGAIFFAYLIYPAVRLLQRRIPRWLAIVTVYAILLLAVGTLWAFIGPKISLEAQMLVRDFPNFVNRANQTILHANSNIVAAVPIEARETAAKTLDQMAGALQRETEVVAGQVL